MADLEWFTNAGLGVFVHWDHASQQGLELSWPMVGGVFAVSNLRGVSVGQYQSSAATFDPQQWDARALAKLIAGAGARYAVLTTKHHAGFAMWPTKLGGFSIANTPFGRDIVREFADAVRGEGMKVGFYFSVSDWHHPDYPAWRDEDAPYRFLRSPPPPTDEQWARYHAFMTGQLRELLTEYGRVDLLWFDGGWERPAPMWRADEVVAMIRSLQPHVLLNDRLPGAGDFRTPEQFVPPRPLDGPWESCMTMNETWGYVPEATAYKSGRQLVHTICETRSRGGNLLLNVSPRGDGSIPPEQVERLRHVARWMRSNAESIHDTEPGLEPWQFYGPSTRRGNRAYLHLLMRPYETVTVRGVRVRRGERVVHLASGRELAFRRKTGVLERAAPDPEGELVIEVPSELVDEDATVLAIDFSG